MIQIQCQENFVNYKNYRVFSIKSLLIILEIRIVFKHNK